MTAGRTALIREQREVLGFGSLPWPGLARKLDRRNPGYGD